MRLRFIDPAGCGCTDCIVGEAVPLDRATAHQIKQLLAGKLISRIGSDTTITFMLSVSVPLDDFDADAYRAIKTIRDFAELAEVEIGDHTFDI